MAGGGKKVLRYQVKVVRVKNVSAQTHTQRGRWGGTAELLGGKQLFEENYC